MTMRVLPGKPYLLGATWTGEGTNFAIYSERADKVELCLFDNPQAKNERENVSLTEVTGHVWHAFLPSVRPGQLYGFRATDRTNLRKVCVSIPANCSFALMRKLFAAK